MNRGTALLVETKLVTKTSGNYWSSTENDSSNAWNYNFNNSNFNNNNKTNNNRLRAVFAYRKYTIREFIRHYGCAGAAMSWQMLRMCAMRT